MTTATSPPPPSARCWVTGRIIANGLLLLLFVILLKGILDHPAWQADARLRYHTTKTWQAGLNPYDPEDVSKVAGEKFDTAFIYPPDALPVWEVFSVFGPAGVRPFFLGFQLLLLAAVLLCWQRYFLDVEDRANPLFFVLCLAGLGNTLLDELRAGNISLLEQALLWWGLAAWLRGRYIAFAVLLWLAAACKLTPLAFSVLLLLPPVRRWGLFVLVWLAMAVRLGLDRVLSPRLFHDFTQALIGGFGGAHDGGKNNPCLPEVLKDVWQWFDDTLDPHGLGLAVLPAYAVIVLVVLGVSWWAWRAICRRFPAHPTHNDARGVRLIFLVCLAYTLTVPRMKDYSYILLLPVVWLVGKWFLAQHPRALIGFVVLLCLSDYSEAEPLEAVYALWWNYLPYFAAAAAWICLLCETFGPDSGAAGTVTVKIDPVPG